MSLEDLSTQLTQHLPDYEVRALWGVFFILVLGICIVLDILKPQKRWVRISWTSVFFLSLTGLIMLPFVYATKLIQKIYIQDVYILYIPLFILFLYQIYRCVFMNGQKKKMKKKVKAKENKMDIHKTVMIVIYSIVGLLSFAILSVSVFSRPYVVLNNMAENDVVEETAVIDIRFTVPVKKDSIEVNTSPDQEIEVSYDNVWIFDDWIDGLRITPVESYPADSKIVIYTTGLSNIFPGGNVHEQSIDFFTPTLPEIESSYFGEIKGAVAVDTDVELKLTGSDGDFVFWDIEVSPSAEYEILRDYKDKVVIDFSSLSQGTEYDVKIFQANRIYNTNTNEEIRLDKLNLVDEIIFKTVEAPGIESFNWKDKYLANTEPLIIEFSEEIDGDYLNDYYSIEPSIDHSISLDDDNKTVRITPKPGFAKGTKYTVTFKEGLKSLIGGYLEEDVTINFNTAGIVYPIAYYPRSNSIDIDKNLSRVSVTFDQAVDKTSAQSKFSISPNISGSFSWSGNTMYYNLSSALEYYTKYTVTIASGIKSVYGYDSSKSYSTAFTTEEEVFILSVPQYYQPSGFDCNLYATKMALSYKGISISTDSMKSSIGVGQNPNTSWVENYGVHWGPVSSYISGFRSNSIKSGWDVTSLLNEIKKGNPVILFWYNGYTQPSGTISLDGGYTGYNGMHSEVVVGFTGRVDNPTSIVLNDPWRGRRYLSVGSFNSLWNYMGRIAIVVY